MNIEFKFINKHAKDVEIAKSNSVKEIEIAKSNSSTEKNKCWSGVVVHFIDSAKDLLVVK